jgi:hypothetical protein
MEARDNLYERVMEKGKIRRSTAIGLNELTVGQDTMRR